MLIALSPYSTEGCSLFHLLRFAGLGLLIGATVGKNHRQIDLIFARSLASNWNSNPSEFECPLSTGNSEKTVGSFDFWSQAREIMVLKTLGFGPQVPSVAIHPQKNRVAMEPIRCSRVGGRSGPVDLPDRVN
jgi:hypothetical protein